MISFPIANEAETLLHLLTGPLLYAHSSFDRVMGYGLKYRDSFNNKHLGRTGKAA
ncbi:MAG: DUF4260 family protein [Bacteroidetes bacterium]|nr:DUF4260 family protein [Bacteroidota bacterium]